MSSAHEDDHDALSPEELDALRVLGRSRRLMVVIVPDGAPARFVAQLSAWNNFVLDTRLIPPFPLPVAPRGDGLVCPFCGTAATTSPDAHDPTCKYRRALTRWAMTQEQIDEQFPEVTED